MRKTTKLTVFMVAFAMLAIACSSGKKDVANPIQTNDVKPAVDASGVPTVKGGKPKPGATVPTSTDTGKVPSTGGGGLPTAKPVTGFKPATLYTAAEDRIGITDDKIVLCIHAALSLSSVFNISQKSLNVYWEYVNKELGGIYGRKIEITYTDDNYGNRPEDVRTAYEGCKAKNPFMLMGGIGFDQIPSVRAWAEQDHQFYVHHIAREDASKKYAFSYLPSVEDVGRISGEWITSQYRSKKIGVLWRDSEHWEPGHRTFKAALAKDNMTTVADVPAQKSASVYTTQIQALKDKGAEVVWIWENALAAIEIIRQAQDQNFTPKWVVFPFNLMSDTLGEDTVSPVAIDGIATWAPYFPGAQNPATKAYQPGKVDGPFARYANIIKQFELQHTRYASGENRDDIVFMTWAGWAQIHKLLLQCGRDCTRNKAVGLLQSGKHTVQAPGCPLDFSRRNVGGYQANVFRAFKSSDGRYGWEETRHCRSGF